MGIKHFKTQLKNFAKLSGSVFQNLLKALVILIGGFIITILAVYFTRQQIRVDENQKFAIICGDLKQDIEARLKAHAQLLRSGAAFFAASDTVTRLEWYKYNSNERIYKNLPGIQGVGYSLLIPKDQLEKHIKKIREEGFPDYTVKPEGDRDIYTSIIYLEPFTGINLKAFGYDMFSETVRRKAMEIARDSNLATLSGKVILVQESKTNVQAGALMYVPVYRNGMPANTLEERRQAIKGWVYSPYRMNDLMEKIKVGWDSQGGNKIHLHIYDGVKTTTDALLYDSHTNENHHNLPVPNLLLERPLVFNGKIWTLQFEQYSEELSVFHGNILIILISGILISLLLFALTLALLYTQIRAREILLLNLQLEKLNADKDRFISILAHDLRSPFNAILGFLTLLKENVHNYSVDKIEYQVNIIRNTAIRTYNLLDEILLWARSQSGKLPFEPVVLSFVDVCQEVVNDLRLMADAKQIELDFYSDTHIEVYADLNTLKTVLRNLVSNGIKFTNVGGKVLISIEENEQEAIVSVSDTGIGIKPDKQKNLFDFAFFDTTLGTAEEKGTGLGLLICKDLVEKHSGKIWVESEPGVGSTFKFSLPKQDK